MSTHSTSTLLEVAEKAENIIHNVFATKGEDFAFSIPEAMLVGIKANSDGTLIDVQPEIASNADIYTLLENVNPKLLMDFTAIGLVTCGWAAPIPQGQDEPESAPSEHPDRRRVRLFVCVSRAEMASVLRFQDESQTPVLDAGEARGPLAEAILDLMSRV